MFRKANYIIIIEVYSFLRSDSKKYGDIFFETTCRSTNEVSKISSCCIVYLDAAWNADVKLHAAEGATFSARQKIVSPMMHFSLQP